MKQHREDNPDAGYPEEANDKIIDNALAGPGSLPPFLDDVIVYHHQHDEQYDEYQRDKQIAERASRESIVNKIHTLFNP